MQAQSEEEFSQLVRLLPPIEAALLDWAINLMADVVEMEFFNKMNSRNVALVFAPNMTRVSTNFQVHACTKRTLSILIYKASRGVKILIYIHIVDCRWRIP